MPEWMVGKLNKATVSTDICKSSITGVALQIQLTQALDSLIENEKEPAKKLELMNLKNELKLFSESTITKIKTTLCDTQSNLR